MSSTLLRREGLWDRMAVMVSGLCLVHCMATMVFLVTLSSLGSALLDPIFHEIGLGLAIALGFFALGRGVLDHGYIMPAAIGGIGIGIMIGALSIGHHSGELLYTMLGVGLLAFGHDLNFRATRGLFGSHIRA